MHSVLFEENKDVYKSLRRRNDDGKGGKKEKKKRQKRGWTFTTVKDVGLKLCLHSAQPCALRLPRKRVEMQFSDFHFHKFFHQFWGFTYKMHIRWRRGETLSWTLTCQILGFGSGEWTMPPLICANCLKVDHGGGTNNCGLCTESFAYWKRDVKD